MYSRDPLYIHCSSYYFSSVCRMCFPFWWLTPTNVVTKWLCFAAARSSCTPKSCYSTRWSLSPNYVRGHIDRNSSKKRTLLYISDMYTFFFFAPAPSCDTADIGPALRSSSQSIDACLHPLRKENSSTNRHHNEFNKTPRRSHRCSAMVWSHSRRAGTSSPQGGRA